MKKLRIITRKSPLALWQTDCVMRRLVSLLPGGVHIDTYGLETEGDINPGGGRELFVKDLERALLDGTADLAVHSMKDVENDLPEGLTISAVLERADPRDALISHRYNSFSELPAHAKIGTSSPRRRAQLSAMRPDLNIVNLRGNVGTRLNALARGQYDAIVLAAAGIERLGLTEHITQLFECDLFVPAIGQGAIGIECHADTWVHDFIRQANDPISMRCIKAERAFSQRLGGGCHLPIAAYAQQTGQAIKMTGLVGLIDGSKIISKTIQEETDDTERLGCRLAEQLLVDGADKILDELRT